MRPATATLGRFIEQHAARFGVAPICRALTAHGIPIAPRTYYAWRARGPSRRALWEVTVSGLLAGYYQPDAAGRRRPESLYGAVKMWALLRRQGVPVARCTVERLMRAHGWQGARRGRRVRTTIAGRRGQVTDLVGRRFRTHAPNRLWVADFTYVPVRRGFGYTAFVIDAYAGVIVGWQTGPAADAGLVARAVADAVEYRTRQGRPITAGAIHHSDAGTQYTSITFGQQLAEAGLQPSIGSVGDAYDNALAETTIGLYKTECVAPQSPFHTGLATTVDVEAATAAWVHWYNTDRLIHRLDRRPPAEAEHEYYAQPADHPVAHK